MAISFGIADALVAPRNATDDYGTAIDVPYIQMMNAALRVVSAEGTGDDRIVVVASRIIAGSVQIRMQGAPFEIFPVIFGITPIVTGVTPNTVTTIRIPGGTRLPGFGIVGQGLAEESLGDQLIFAPYLKITSDITVMGMEYSNLNVLEFTATAIDDETYGILNLVERETTGTIVLPPTGITTP